MTGFLDVPENDWRIPDPGETGKRDDIPPLPRWPIERQEGLRCMLLFGYASAGRRAELAETTMNAVVRSGQRWVWKVVGKGRKAVDAPDRVTLNEAAINALMRYRITRGLPPYPDSTEKNVPLIAKLTPLRTRKNRQLATGPGVSADHLNKVLQRYFHYAAPFAAGKPAKPRAAAAALEVITGPLLGNPYRVGRQLSPPLEDRYSARRGTYRVLYRIHDEACIVTVLLVTHRRDAYRTR